VTASLFLVEALPPGDAYTLDGPEGHHAATVQRLRVGEVLLLGDGRGSTAVAIVTAVGRGSLEVRIGARSYEPRPHPRLVVVQGIAKGERGELAVQAMAECGVDTIVPWSAARSIVQWKPDRKGRQRWVDTVREAAKQARRAWVPEVGEQESTKDLEVRLAGALILHQDAETPLTTVDLPGGEEVVLVVGPEGGITPEELTAFESAGAHPVRLGTEILRTSTAGPAALAILNMRLGRW